MHDSERTRPYEELLCVSRNRYSFEGALMVKTRSCHHTSFEHWPNSAAHIVQWPVTAFAAEPSQVCWSASYWSSTLRFMHMKLRLSSRGRSMHRLQIALSASYSLTYIFHAEAQARVHDCSSTRHAWTLASKTLNVSVAVWTALSRSALRSCTACKLASKLSTST